MTEPSLPPPDKPATPEKPEAHAQRLLMVAIALIVIGGGGLLAWDRLRDRGEVVTRPLPTATRSPPQFAPAPETPSAPSAAPSAAPPSSSRPAERDAPPPSTSAPDLSSRIADLERRLAATPPSEPAPSSAADAQIAQLEARVATLETSVATERARADRAEQAARAAADRLNQMTRAATAVARLRTSLERGQPFDREYDDVYAILAGNPAAVGRLQALRAWAESGIPTRAELREALDSQGSDIVRAALLENGGNWWQAIVARLKSLVIVRPTPDTDVPEAGAPGGDKPAAVVARAEAKVRDGDVSGAISEMTTLTGGAADVALAWVAAARARVSADDTIAAIEESLQSIASPSTQRNDAPSPELP
ncbi:MAG: COG4223 family protein [Gemmatimonas sp.]